VSTSAEEGARHTGQSSLAPSTGWYDVGTTRLREKGPYVNPRKKSTTFRFRLFDGHPQPSLHPRASGLAFSSKQNLTESHSSRPCGLVSSRPKVHNSIRSHSTRFETITKQHQPWYVHERPYILFVLMRGISMREFSLQ
jgi:hypothetical protein